MADINTPVSFSGAIQTLVDSKLNDGSFSFRNWGDEDLEDLRKVVRDHYRTEQRGTCAFCRAAISLHSADNCHVEHVVPKSKRPEFIFEPRNLCVICADCNTIKRDKEVTASEPDPLTNGAQVKRYPRSSGAFLIVHPHFDSWEEHIARFGSLYVDLSDKGHFTIGTCMLNRVLRKFGWEAVITDSAALRDAASTLLTATDPIVYGRALAALKRLLVTI